MRRNLEQDYRVVERAGLKTAVLGTIGIEDVEREILNKFREVLRDTPRFENYEQRLTEAEQTVNQRKTNLQGLINELAEEIDGIFLTLKSPKLKAKQRDEFVEERNKLIERRERLQKELSIQSPLQTYLKYKDLIELMGKYWERYPLEDRQALVALLVRRVFLEPLSKSFIKLTIEWKEFPEDVGIMWRGESSSQFSWTPEEITILQEVFPTEPHQAILDALPHRSWAAIRVKARSLSLRRLVDREAVPFNYNLSMEDVAVAETYGIPLETVIQSRTVNQSLFTTWCWGSRRPSCHRHGRLPRNSRKECHNL